MNYTMVTEALARGADPTMLCTTCPWDRHCVTPPTMTRAEVDAKITEAQQEDEKAMAAAYATGKPHDGMPVRMLLHALVYSGKDTYAHLCPVFALRLRLSEGHTIVDGVKAVMQAQAAPTEHGSA